MGQMGFFDLGNRYSGLDAKNEPLLKIDAVVPWEDVNGGAKRDHLGGVRRDRLAAAGLSP